MQYINDDGEPIDFFRIKLALSDEVLIVLKQFGFRVINTIRTPLSYFGYFELPEGWSERIDDLNHGWLIDEYGYDRIQLQLERKDRCYHIVCVSARPANVTEQ